MLARLVCGQKLMAPPSAVALQLLKVQSSKEYDEVKVRLIRVLVEQFDVTLAVHPALLLWSLSRAEKRWR